MAEEIIDALGEACPVPLIKVKNALEEMNIGDVLILQIDHSCAMKNVPEWARKEGYNVEVDEVDNGEWKVIIEKTK